MVSVLDRVLSWGSPVVQDFPLQPRAPVRRPKIAHVEPQPYVRFIQSMIHRAWNSWDGEKYPGGLPHGDTWASVVEMFPDMPTLRARSANLFRTNLYARGLVRRLVLAEIHSGLQPEATPVEKVLGFPERGLTEWAEDVEVRFSLWAESDACLPDYSRQMKFGPQQQLVRMEALLAGDTLIVQRSDPDTQLPTFELVRGEHVCTPPNMFDVPEGHRIVEGVEIDSRRRHVAYHVRRPSTKAFGLWEYERVPARDDMGRVVSWLVYGTERRCGEVRGEPLLALCIQSLSEIDRFRDSAQRKAWINALLAVFIQREGFAMGTNPLTNAASANGVARSSHFGAPGLSPQEYNISEQFPGVALENLAPGEKPVAFSTDGTDVGFGPFENAMMSGIAWGNNVPPEVLRLGFSSNYSAAQGAINEFQLYNGERRADFDRQFLSKVYSAWLIGSVARGDIQARGLVTAAVDVRQFDVYEAWTRAEWSGAMKPTADPVKTAKAMDILINKLQVMSRHKACKLWGYGKWTEVVRTLDMEARTLERFGLKSSPAESEIEDASMVDTTE